MSLIRNITCIESRAAGRNINQGLSCVQQLQLPSRLQASGMGGIKRPTFLDRQTSEEKRELILCLTAFAFAFTLDRPTEIRENPSVHPGGNRFRQIKEEEEGKEEKEKALGWVPRIGPLQTNTHVNSCLLFFTFWSSLSMFGKVFFIPELIIT